MNFKFDSNGALATRAASACLVNPRPSSPRRVPLILRTTIQKAYHNDATKNMPSAVAPNQRATSPKSHDRPNYDQEVDDFMRDLDFDNNTANTNPAPQEPAKDIDEEVQVKKKRKPNPKLDETRLLSQNGVPKLRRLTKSKLRFCGKGHEYTDITMLLNMYQLWLDDLYPKAKFKDGLAMVEKVGHSKRMQITRKAWLDSTKPHRREDSPERVGDVEMSGGLGSAEDEERRKATGDDDDEIFTGLDQQEGSRPGDTGGHESAPEDDELDARLNEDAQTRPTSSTRKQRSTQGPFEEVDDVEDDELDALLAEQTGEDSAGASRRPVDSSKVSNPGGNEPDDFADDEEAMASLGW